MTFDAALFALDCSSALGDEVARALGIERAAHEERDFDGGEHKTRSLISVRGLETFLIASLAV